MLSIRGTGKSTAEALKLIALCIENPGEWKRCQDHTIPFGVDQHKANRHFADLVMDLVFAMRLNFESQKTKEGKYILRSTHYGFKIDENGQPVLRTEKDL